jgi:hypothetical protein
MVKAAIAFEFGLHLQPTQPNRQPEQKGNGRQGGAAAGRQKGCGHGQAPQQKRLASALLGQRHPPEKTIRFPGADLHL